MPHYLSRLALSKAPSTRALDAILNPENEGQRLDAHHRLLWAAFADGPNRTRDFLWREDRPGSFLTLSQRPPAANDLFAPPDVKEFAPQLAPGDRLAFSLRANATRDRKGTGRVDVVMDALAQVPKVERAAKRQETAQQEGAAWLSRQAVRGGFRILDVAVENYSVLALPSYRGKRSGQPQFGILDLFGVLEVTEPGVFLNRVTQGFGRARAFGCGLMLIRRAVR